MRFSYRGAIVGLALLFHAGTAFATTYTYDPEGRLLTATDPSGNTNTYTYDVRGNRISIAQTTVPPGITDFAPSFGMVGEQIAVTGTGFATSAAGDTVTLGGVSTVVLSGTPTQLLLQVPNSAVTGPIVVTTSSGTATSLTNFLVTPYGQPPAITGVSPLAVQVGATVTISGTNLNPIPGQTGLLIGGVYVPISSISGSAISFQVPIWAVTGYVTVATPLGSATTTLVVRTLTADEAANDYQAPQLNPVGGAAISLTATGSGASSYSGLETTFNQSAGDWNTLQISYSPSQSPTYALYDPASQEVAYGTLYSDGAIHLPKATRTGAYKLIISNSGTITAKLTSDSHVAAVSSQTITPSSSSSQRLIIDGGSAAMGVTLSGFTGSGSFSEQVADGVTNTADASNVMFVSTTCYAGSGVICDGNIEGGVPVQIVLGVTSVGSYTLTLTQDTFLTMTPGATPSTLSSTVYGQNTHVSFNGVAGTSYTFTSTGLTSSPSSTGPTATATDASGTVLVSTTQFPDGTSAYTIPPLASSGTVNLFLDGLGQYSTSLSLNSYAVPPITVDGAAVNVDASQPGQSIFASFTAAAGDNLGVGLYNLAMANGTTYFSIDVIDVNGNSISGTQDCYLSSVECLIPLDNLAAGTYYIRGQTSDQVSFTALVSHDATVSYSGSSVTAATTRIGQRVRVSISSPSTTQAVVSQLASNSSDFSSGQVFMIDPTGNRTPLGYVYAVGDRAITNIGEPDQPSGTWTLLFVPANGYASLTVSTPTAPGGTASVGGSGVSVSSSYTGQAGLVTFSGSSGGKYGIGLTGLSFAGGASVNATLYAPDNSVAVNTLVCAPTYGGCTIDFPNAPQTGTYKLLLEPQGTTFSLTTTVSSDVTGTLTTTAHAMNLSVLGQHGWQTFSGTSGTAPQITASSVTPTPGTNNALLCNLYNPSGVFISTITANSSKVCVLPSLSVTGTWAVSVYTRNASTMSMSIKRN